MENHNAFVGMAVSAGPAERSEALGVEQVLLEACVKSDNLDRGTELRGTPCTPRFSFLLVE